MLDGNLKEIPAPDVRRDLIRDQHVLSGHLGWKRTTALLCQKYYWAKLDSDVRLVLSVCHECKRRHVAFTAKDPILHPLQPKGLCYRWGLDLCQLPTTAWGFQRVMICVEHLSRYVIIIPLRNKSAEAEADVQERRRLVGRAPAYRWLNDKLWRTMLDGNLKEIPAPDVRRDLIRDQHVLSGHLGWKRTTALLCQKYYWAKLDSDVRLVLSVCHECKRRHVAFTAKDPILHPLQPKGLCYRWGLDLCQLPTTAWGFQRVMICVEHLSRYVIIIPLRNKSSAEVAFAFLTQVIATYGVCGEVLSDQGGEFMGEMHCLLQRNGIEHRRTSAYRAQSNGLAERAVQTVKKAVSKLAASKGKQSSSFQWEWELAYLQLAYNSSPQASTKLTPSQVMMAQAPEMPPSLRTHLDVPIDLWALDADQVNVAADLVRRAEQVKRLGVQATANLQVAQHRDSKQYARRQSGAYVRPSFVPKAGDYVYLYHKPLNSTSMSTDKLPVRIVSISKDGVATMEGALFNGNGS